MHAAISANVRKTLYGMILTGLILFLLFGINNSSAASAKANKFLIIQKVVLKDGTTLNGTIINGPPVPPPGYDLQRKSVSLPQSSLVSGTASLTVPAYMWSFGCSATSGSMIAGYYDRNGFPNMYTGPTDGGVMPLDSSTWPNWTDGAGATYAQNPLDATRNGLDGRSTRGSIDDYWVSYSSSAQDPYITNSWTQHAWGDAIGDYMKTSQSAYGNVDGSTAFYNFTNSATPLTCSAMVSYGIDQEDGTYGRKLFYESRGYTVTDCYNQATDNIVSGGFSFAQYKAEIDAGRPVMLNLAGHTIVGVGYDNSTNTIYIHDTWDYDTHTMTWGGSYSGMQLQSVSIVNLVNNGSPTITSTPSLTPTKTLTATVTPTPSTTTKTPTRTATITKTRTPTITKTPSRTPTPTRTPTVTKTSTRTSTSTRTRTPTRTPTPRTTTSTRTPTPTLSSAIAVPVLLSPGNGGTASSRKPTFTWGAVAGATGYTIQIGRNSSFTSLVGTYSVTAVTYTPTANLPRGTLYWRVRGNGPSGSSAWSVSFSLVVR